MNTSIENLEQKAKPFRLVKYFTFTSLVVIFIGFLVLTGLNIRWARQMQLKKSEDYAHVLVENLNHQIFLQFIIPVVLSSGKIELKQKEQSERMDKIVRSTLHSFKVEMVNIYDMKNTISYSFEKNSIGKMNMGGTGYQHALAGKSTSRLVQNGNFREIFFGIPTESRLITFAPLRAEKLLSPITGPVLGVVEIIQDLTDDNKTIFRFQIAVVITCALVMGGLFLVLLLVVNRGEKIIEARVRERFELKEQLNKARHMSSLGEMTAGISHEIRNPLGIIKSSAELLKKKMTRLDPVNTLPDIIVEETGRLNNIITDFLNFARPKIPAFNPCRIDEVINKNIEFLSSQLEEGGHKVMTALADDLPEVMADGDMLYQAFLNILMNAMQAMPDGGKIDIKMETDQEGISIVFKDNGSGITDVNLEKVWDPFFTTKDKGTGLGLGIVKNIIEVHGGRVFLENQPDGGVSLTVKLPIKQKG